MELSNFLQYEHSVITELPFKNIFFVLSLLLWQLCANSIAHHPTMALFLDSVTF